MLNAPAKLEAPKKRSGLIKNKLNDSKKSVFAFFENKARGNVKVEMQAERKKMWKFHEADRSADFGVLNALLMKKQTGKLAN